jgi:hypothetical protein
MTGEKQKQLATTSDQKEVRIQGIKRLTYQLSGAGSDFIGRNNYFFKFSLSLYDFIGRITVMGASIVRYTSNWRLTPDITVK